MAWIPESLRNYENNQVVWPTSYPPLCYGFNGPSACTSSTCLHNPLIEQAPIPRSYSSYFSSPSSYAKYTPLSPMPEFYPSSKTHQSPFCQLNSYDDYLPETDWYPMKSTHRKNPWSSDLSFYERSIFEDYKLDPLHMEFYEQLEAEYLDLAYTFNASDQKIGSTLIASKQSENFEQKNEKIQSSSILLPSANSAFEWYKSNSNKSSYKMKDNKNLETSTKSLYNHFKERSRSSSEDSGTDFEKFKYSSNDCPEKSTKSFACLICFYRCDTKDELDQHIVNKIRNPYECSICGATFPRKYSLQRHQAIHSSKILFTCRGCNKAFSQIKQLTKHYENCNYKIYRF